MADELPVLLFSYGTLQNKQVQLQTFGRQLTGHQDTLRGYIRRWVAQADPEVYALTGEAQYASVEPSGNPEDAVSGTVLEITEPELELADKYEASAFYHRMLVTLGSGNRAWVYLLD